MPFAAAVSVRPSTPDALQEVCSHLAAQQPGQADLALAFFSPHHAAAADKLARGLRTHLQPKHLLGCVAESVVADGREIEGAPALAVWLAKWARPVEAEPFHLMLERTSEGLSLLGWPDALVEARPGASVILLLGDPYTLPADLFLDQVNESHPGLPVLGGMASGVRGPGQCRLLFGDEVRDAGGVGVLLRGELGLRSVVSQGCRPIGRPLVVTKAADNLIEGLGGRPPLAVLQELWPTLTPREQRLFGEGLFVGRAIDEYRETFGRGDFLVRNVMGVERETGAMAVSDRVRVGTTVQFHVRDAETADEDLKALLARDAGARRPAGGLLFSCNGRGTRLFARPDHDAGVIQGAAGPLPLAGFFAQGELGPVGGRNFIHGFTASVALFEE